MEAQELPAMQRRVQKESVAVAAHIERLIAIGSLQPGSKLASERELALSLSVSRSTLREAMHELESKRLITRRPGRGTIVLPPSAEADDLKRMSPQGAGRDDVAELRLVVEPTIASLAARRATAANLLVLQDIIDQSGNRLNAADSLRLDLEFHLLLAQAAGNPLLTSLHGLMAEWAADVRRHSHSTPKGRRESARGHQEIFEAVRAADPEAARTAMERHLSQVRQLIEQTATDKRQARTRR
jgi:GntR family transcriptional repressor for pyruvate dehydrogenase complex